MFLTEGAAEMTQCWEACLFGLTCKSLFFSSTFWLRILSLVTTPCLYLTYNSLLYLRSHRWQTKAVSRTAFTQRLDSHILQVLQIFPSIIHQVMRYVFYQQAEHFMETLDLHRTAICWWDSLSVFRVQILKSTYSHLSLSKLQSSVPNSPKMVSRFASRVIV